MKLKPGINDLRRGRNITQRMKSTAYFNLRQGLRQTKTKNDSGINGFLIFGKKFYAIYKIIRYLLSYTSFPVMIDDLMRPNQHTHVHKACCNICLRVMGRAYVWQVKVSRKPITYPLLTCIKNIGMLCVQELFLVGWVDYLKHVYILTKGKKSIKAEKNENVELSHTQVFCGRLCVLCE